jgi:hypothetical protein
VTVGIERNESGAEAHLRWRLKDARAALLPIGVVVSTAFASAATKATSLPPD